MTLRAIIWAAVSTQAQANESEKYSLPAQIADAQALCEREGWMITDTLTVPGHSRNYKSLDKLAEDAASKGIDAFYRLIDHLEACDFDVLICRDANRFARKASLLHYIVESIIEDCDARIYSFNDGWIDAQNADLFAMIKGYTTAKEMRWLHESSDKGKDKLIQRGLPTGMKFPMTHQLIRDASSGKAARVELNPAMQPMMLDVAALLLEGVSWNQLANELYRRFGHAADNGKPYSANTFYYILCSPFTWGHTGRGYSQTRTRFAAWVWDENCPLPDGVKIERNTIPAVYTGELAERVKAELNRRIDLTGSSHPRLSYRFSNLAVCGECGSRMNVRSQKDRRYGLKCPTYDAMSYQTTRSCTQTAVIPTRVIQAYIDTLLRTVLADTDAPLFRAVTTPDTGLDTTAADIARIEAQIDTLITEQSLAPASLQDSYRRQLTQLADTLEHKQRRLDELKRAARNQQRSRETETRTLEDIRRIGLENFWKQDDVQINQTLKRLFGKRRLVILNRQVVGIWEG